MKYVLLAPIQLLVAVLYFFYNSLGKVLAPIMVTLGMLTGWPRIFWPWNNITWNSDGNYADGHWYREPLHWSWSVGPKFAEWYWRALRNAFSNGARYTLSSAEDVYVVKSHETLGRPKGDQNFARVPVDAVWAWDYYVDKNRPWLARFRACRFGTPTKGRYFQFYLGFKVDRSEGMGFSARVGFPKNEGK